VASRLAPEKGVKTAIAACRIAGLPLVVAGDGPERPLLAAQAMSSDVRFVGQVDAARLAELRHGATVALVPSHSAETFGLAAAEAMAAGLPVVASAVGALPEVVHAGGLVPPGDAEAMARAIARVSADEGAARAAIERARAICAPEVIAPKLAAVYGA
jgi:glycosyltransferase involved in cell wall biosynthesis